MWQRNKSSQRVPLAGDGGLMHTSDKDTLQDPSNKSTCESPTQDSGYLSGPLSSSQSITSEYDATRSPSKGTSTYNKSSNKDKTNPHTSSTALDSGIGLSGDLSALSLGCSSSNLESGLGLSEHFSDLYITNTSTASPTHTQSHSNVTEDVSRQAEPETSKRSGIALTQEHLMVLKNIFSRDEYGDTALHIAVNGGFIEAIDRITRLIPHQALLDITNDRGSTALHVAVSSSKGNCEIIRRLVVCGCSPVCRDNKGDTPLHIACRNKDYQAVVNLTAPVNMSELVQARLYYTPSLRGGSLAADFTNYVGETCMHVAVQKGCMDILQHLSWYGADINAKEEKGGRTVLHYAVESRDPSLVNFVVNNCGAFLNVENYAGLTPYQLAEINGATGIAAVLLDLGAHNVPLPVSYTLDDDDLDYDEVSTSLGAVGSNGCLPVDDFKIAGFPLNMAAQVPVSTCAPFDADRYF